MRKLFRTGASAGLLLWVAGCAVAPAPPDGGEPSNRRLYLVRHGTAQPADADPARPLTATGTAEVKRVAAFLRPLGLRVGAVWHSGLTRARQTAGLLAPAFTADGGIGALEGLKPRDPVEPFLVRLTAARSNLVVVGHRPWLAALAATLLGAGTSGSPVDFAEGGVVCLEAGDGGAWRVKWMVTPELVR